MCEPSSLDDKDDSLPAQGDDRPTIVYLRERSTSRAISSSYGSWHVHANDTRER